MTKLSTIAQSLADEIRVQDWSDAHTRADGARHDRTTDRTTSEQLDEAQTELVRLNVMWVVAQALSDHDPNFDVHAFAEAAGVPARHRLRRDGSPSGVIPAGLRPPRAATYTPEQLAGLMGHEDEGKAVRKYLRKVDPGHQKYEPWLLTAAEALAVLSNLPHKR